MGYGFITQAEKDPVIGYRNGIPIKQNLQGKYLDWTSPQGYKIPLYEGRGLPNAAGFNWANATDEQLQGALDGYTTWLASGGATESNLVKNAAVSALQVAPLVYGLGAIGGGAWGGGGGLLGGGGGAGAAGGGIGGGLGTAGATTTGAGAATGGALTGIGTAAGTAAYPTLSGTSLPGLAQPIQPLGGSFGGTLAPGISLPAAAPYSLPSATLTGADLATGLSTLNTAAGAAAAGGGLSAGLTQTGRTLVHGTPETIGGSIGSGLSTAVPTTTAAAAGTATGLLGEYEWLAPLLGLVSPGGGGGAGDSTMGPVGGGGGGGLGTDYTKGLESSLSALDFFRKKQLDADTQRLKTSMLQRGIMGSGIERDALTKLMSESAGQTEAAAQGAAIDWARLSQANAAQQYDWSQKVGLTREGVANQASQANQDARAKAWQLILSTPGLADKIKGFFS